MIELTVAQIAEIVGGAVADISPQDAAHRRVTGTVEFDSRAIGPGGLFLALPGARADGHDHAAICLLALMATLATASRRLRPGRNGIAGGLTRWLYSAPVRTAVALRQLRSGRHVARSNSRLPTTLNARDQPPAEVSDQRVSGLTGAVQVSLI